MHNVAVCGQTPAHLDAARERLHGTGPGDVLAVEADITDRAEIAAFVAETVEAFDGLDHVVTSAGGPPSGPFLNTEDADWYRAYDLLVMSAVWTLRETYPHLCEGGGSAVAITSRTVCEVADGLVLSNAVRRTVERLVKTLAHEFAPAVRVNTVLPGPHETGRIEELIEAAVDRGEVPDYEAGYREWAADIPLERIGDPRELGDVVAVLASERASYINGAAIPIDSGVTRG